MAVRRTNYQFSAADVNWNGVTGLFNRSALYSPKAITRQYIEQNKKPSRQAKYREVRAAFGMSIG